MSEPTPDPLIDVLTRVAVAVESLATQQETANLLNYNGQPMTQVKQAIGRRLGIPASDEIPDPSVDDRGVVGIGQLLQRGGSR